MSAVDVGWLVFLYMMVGCIAVSVLRRYVPHDPTDDDIELRYVADGLSVLIWPVLVALGAFVGVVWALGRIVGRGTNNPRETS